MPKPSLPNVDWDYGMDKKIVGPVSMAFKALEKGNASPEQQKLALDFLIKIGCRTYDIDWFPQERFSCFAAGRRFVGQQIVRFLNLRIGETQNG